LTKAASTTILIHRTALIDSDLRQHRVTLLYRIAIEKLFVRIVPVCTFLHSIGPRTDETHIPLQNIEYLRKFIQISHSEQPTKPKDALVPFLGYYRLSIDTPKIQLMHRPKFIAGKFMPVLPRAALFKQYRPFGAHLYK